MHENRTLGQMLLSTLLGIQVIIFTVSSVTVIPVIYWSVAGVGVAYVRMLKVAKAPVNEPATARHDSFQPANTKRRGGCYVLRIQFALVRYTTQAISQVLLKLTG
jgi:hypothetical protein